MNHDSLAPGLQTLPRSNVYLDDFFLNAFPKHIILTELLKMYTCFCYLYSLEFVSMFSYFFWTVNIEAFTVARITLCERKQRD